MTTKPELIVHHLNQSRSERIFWVLEELNVPYSVKVWYRDPQTAPQGLKDVYPLGKAPVIVDGDKTVAESGAIVDYIIHTYAPDRGFSLPDSYWSHFSEGSLMLMLQMHLTFTFVAGQVPWLIRPIVGAVVSGVQTTYINVQVQQMVDLMNTRLAASPTGWFSEQAEPGAGDFMLCFPIRMLLEGGRVKNLKTGEHLPVWWAKVKARPAYQKAMKRVEEEEAKGKK